MHTLITYPSAYSFWMRNDVAVQRVARTSAIQNMTISMDTGYYENLASMLSINLPIHCLVPGRKERRIMDQTVCHLSPNNLPDDFFVEIAPSACVLSPELCFLLSARELSLSRLVMETTNLCGSYYYDAKGNHKSRKPITSTEKLKVSLDRANGLKGIKKARMALQYCMDFSHSPVETQLAVNGILPLSHGGAGLIKPELNWKVILPPGAQKYLQREYCICDLVWPEQKVIVEYDSKEYHLNEDSFFYDKRRVTVLNQSGYKVISVTSSDLSSFQGIEKLFQLIRESLGIRTRKDRLDKYREIRRQTVKEIFFTPEPWNLQ